MNVLVALSCPTLCNSMDNSLPGSSVDGILGQKILEWVAIPFSRESSWPRDQTWVSCIADRLFTIWVIREAQSKCYSYPQYHIMKVYSHCFTLTYHIMWPYHKPSITHFLVNGHLVDSPNFAITNNATTHFLRYMC